MLSKLLFKKKARIINRKKNDDLLVDRIFVVVSETCFFRCKTCKIWNTQHAKNTNKLSLGDYKKLFRDLRKICKKQSELQLTGGEPLLNQNLPGIIYEAYKNEFSPHLITNGWLITEKIVTKLLKSNLNKIAFSLDGTQKVHDYIRGYQGSYNRIMKAIKLFKSTAREMGKEIEIKITITLSGLNINNVPKLIEVLIQNKDIFDIWIQSVSPPFADNRIDLWGKMDYQGRKLFWYEHPEYYNLLPRKIEDINKTFNFLMKMKKRPNKMGQSKIANWDSNLKQQYHYFLNPELTLNPFSCSHFKNIFVTLSGKVYQCFPQERSIGNIKEKSIIDIWNSNRRLHEKEVINKCKINCHAARNCESPISEHKEITGLKC